MHEIAVHLAASTGGKTKPMQTQKPCHVPFAVPAGCVSLR